MSCEKCHGDDRFASRRENWCALAVAMEGPWAVCWCENSLRFGQVSCWERAGGGWAGLFFCILFYNYGLCNVCVHGAASFSTGVFIHLFSGNLLTVPPHQPIRFIFRVFSHMAPSRQSITLAIVAGLLVAAVAPAAAFISNCANFQDDSITVYDGAGKAVMVRRQI